MENGLTEILEYVEQLGEVDTEGVEPMIQPVIYGNVLRDDTVTNADERDALMASAPSVNGEYYQVPRSI